ncbi:MAG: hypothetical protein ABUL62_15650 [Myxococcales bacterium]
MTQRIAEQTFAAGARRDNAVSLGSALFLTVLVVVALAALAFWPTKEWAPPPRPGIRAPIVFDDFVNPTNP